MSFTHDGFLSFLIKAKLNAYAAQGDDASVPPVLNGSKQLEFEEGPFTYRDIYFGMCYFIGQETAYHNDVPVWSMCYGGGVPQSYSEEEARNIYRILQQSLRLVSHEYPYRGPKEFIIDSYVYTDNHAGSLESFQGIERITKNSIEVYRLDYFGGFIR